MKNLIALIISGALVVSGYSQTRNVLVNSNNAVVSPTNFWSVDASNARTGLGLGSAATNPATAFQSSSSVLSNLVSSNAVNLTNLRSTNIVGVIPASNIPTVSLTNFSGTLALTQGGTGATNAGGARTNLGLGVTNTVQFGSLSVAGGDLYFGANGEIGWSGEARYEPETQTFQGTVHIENGSISLVGSNAASNIATTRTNLGLGWPALTNSNAGTGLVSVNTNGVVVSPTNFWQAAPIQTLVQDFTLIGGTQTNNATNARNLYVYSLNTNLGGVSNTIILPTNAATFNGDEATVIHKGTTNTATVIRQAGSTNNLITLSRFDESVKFIRESGQWDFYHNISHVEPIQFSGTNASANAAASRTNIGIGWSALTNTNASTSLLGFTTNGQVIAPHIAFTNNVDIHDVSFATYGGGTMLQAGGNDIFDITAGIFVPSIQFSMPIQFPNTNAINGTRANLGFSTNLNTLWTATNASNARSAAGLGATWLTNTNVTNFRTAIGLGATSRVEFRSLLVGYGINQDYGLRFDEDGIILESQGQSYPYIKFEDAGGPNFTIRLGGGISFNTNAPFAAGETRTNLGLGGTNIVTFAGLTNNGDITINQTTATNGLLFIYRTNNEAFLGLANLIASNNTTISNETLFRVGVAEATNRSAQFGFRSTNTNGNGVAVFSVFGYNALMMIGPSARSATNAAIEADIYSVNPTNRVATLIDTNTGAFTLHRPIGFRTNETNASPTNAGNFNTHAAWLKINIGTNTFYVPVYQ